MYLQCFDCLYIHIYAHIHTYIHTHSPSRTHITHKPCICACMTGLPWRHAWAACLGGLHGARCLVCVYGWPAWCGIPWAACLGRADSGGLLWAALSCLCISIQQQCVFIHTILESRRRRAQENPGEPRRAPMEHQYTTGRAQESTGEPMRAWRLCYNTYCDELIKLPMACSQWPYINTSN